MLQTGVGLERTELRLSSNSLPMVLVIPLRDTEDNESVGDIARRYLPDSNRVQPRQIDEYIIANPDKVFIILDGLDEYKCELIQTHGNDIVQILRSDRLRTCTVLVTTRPWKADQVSLYNYAFIAIEGFNEESRSLYIQRFLEDDEASTNNLIQFLDDNDVIKDNIAPYPLYLSMLCCNVA